MDRGWADILRNHAACQVGRRGDALADAAAAVAVSAAVGPAVALRADANRCWSLEQAVAFCQAAVPAQLEVGVLDDSNKQICPPKGMQSLAFISS